MHGVGELNMKRAFCIAILAGGIAAPAGAADIPVRMPVKAPVVAPMFNWTGFYGGVNGGYAWADSRVSMTETGGPSSASVSLDLDSWFAGLQGGFNQQFSNNYVWGVEADIQWANGSDTAATPIGFPAGGGPTTVRGRLDWFGTLRARLGYAQDRTLYYVTGGLAFPGAKFSVFMPFDVDTLTLSGRPKLGWVAGAGVEWALHGNWTAKFEYQYLNFGAKTVSGISVGPQSIPASAKFDLDMHTLRFGLNYRFVSGG
jgi:outer membrane immunogenic protein